MRTYSYPELEGDVVEQSELLRHWMKLTGLTRKQAAEKLDIKSRRFDCWLLPVSSKERRGADSSVLAQVATLIAEAEKISRDTNEGKLFEGIDAAEPYICDRTGVVFPALFRVSNPTLRFVDEAKGLTEWDGGFYLEYSFTPRVRDGGHAEEISHLDADHDATWLSIVHLNSYAEVEGFWLGNLNAYLDDICTCQYNGSFFGLKREIGREENNGHISFTTRYLADNPYMGWCTDFNTVVIDPNGNRGGDECLHSHLMEGR